jgi:hypothetical protein
MRDENALGLPPALETFGADLALRMRELHGQSSAPRPRRRPWQLVKQHSRISAAVAFAALAAASAGLADASGLLGTAQPTSPNTDQVAPLAQAPDPTDLAMLGILRRPQQPGDALPAEADRTQDPIARSTGENPALAREVSFGALGDAWVIPADGGVCLQSQGAGCDNDVDGHPPYIQLLSGGIDHPGVYHITGLVPDGVSSVTLHLADGTDDVVAVQQNVYMADVRSGTTSTTFTLLNGTTVTLPGNSAPSSAPATAACARAVGTACTPTS